VLIANGRDPHDQLDDSVLFESGNSLIVLVENRVVIAKLRIDYLLQTIECLVDRLHRSRMALGGAVQHIFQALELDLHRGFSTTFELVHLSFELRLKLLDDFSGNPSRQFFELRIHRPEEDPRIVRAQTQAGKICVP
jgi:hypothetical protein